MKDLSEASYILGRKIYRDRSKRMLGLSQFRYIDLVLKRFSMDGTKRDYLPMSQDIHLSKKISLKIPEERKRMSSVPYTSTVGSIMYAILCTKPDVTCTLGIASHFQTDPEEDHWKAVKNIFKYLGRTKDIFLVYGGSNLKLGGYSDFSFQSNPNDSKSTSGYIFTLNSRVVS